MRIFCLFLILASFCYPAFSASSNQEQADAAVAIYGEGLYDAPPIMREAFLSQKNKLWHQASFDERLAFINNWKKDSASVLKMRNNLEKQQLQEKKRLERVAKNRKRAEKQREMARINKKKQEENVKRNRERQMKKLIKDRERALKKMRSNQDSRRN